jgi:hypothetical protein
LTIDQYNTFLAALPLIEAALAERKVEVVRPDFDTNLSAVRAPKDANQGGDEDEQEDEAVQKVDDEEEDE